MKKIAIKNVKSPPKNLDDFTQRSRQTVCKNDKHVFHFCRRRKINRRLIMNINCKETVLCYNLSVIIIVDDNFRYSMTLIIACEQAPSEGGKKIRRSKALFRERSEWDACTISSPDRSRLVPLTLDYTPLASFKREPVRRLL